MLIYDDSKMLLFVSKLHSLIKFISGEHSRADVYIDENFNLRKASAKQKATFTESMSICYSTMKYDLFFKYYDCRFRTRHRSMKNEIKTRIFFSKFIDECIINDFT
ncbi:hypothetical protein RF11_11464 [Thelohanellus kitauei]|uniref:Uncharacterized protein n=1 Tax=Thelohanellus kitauei TaxID=669202 RepID=A0A0C2MSC6_THEKT|nr:hypothetical protein RF11_11464 [Thelohanellus kitauei]